MQFESVHFKRLKEVTAFVTDTLQHVGIVVHLIQIVLVDDPIDFVEVARDVV